MSRNRKIAAFFMALALVTGASLAVAFPFWLSQPTRSNANDPQSPLHYQELTAAVTNTPLTPQATNTYTNTNTYTATNTYTKSPTFTSTYTATGGAPTFTQTPGPGPNLANFEGSANGNWANDDWNQPIVVGADTADGTTINTPGGSSLGTTGWVGGDQTCGAGYEGPSAAGTCSGCISGTMAKLAPTAVPAVYPYAYMALQLTPTGESGAAGVPLSTILTYDTNQGITFDYKGTAGVSYVVQMVTVGAAGCGNFWQYAFSPPASNTWYTVTVYFPNVNTYYPTFSQPNYGCSGAGATDPWGGSTQVGAVQFKAEGTNTSSTEPYTLCVDNVSFTVPAAPAPPAPSAMLASFDDCAYSANDDWNEPIYISADSNGSTVTPAAWGAGDCAPTTGTNPPAGFPNAGCVSGVIDQQVTTPSTDYPFVAMAMSLTPTGNAGTAGVGVPVSTVLGYPNAGNQGIQFNYEGTPGVQYLVQLMTAGTGSCGNFYQYQFSPAAANTWYNMVVYFPNVVTSGLVFSQPNYGCGTTTWNGSTLLGAVQFKVVFPTSGGNQNYSLCVNDLTFNVPTPPEPPALDSNGTGITDFEEGPFSNNVPLAPFAASGGGIYLGPPGGTGSTCNQCPWTAGSGVSSTGPGGTDGLFSGATPEYPSNFGSTHATCLEMTGSLAASGWNTMIVGLVSGTPNQNPTAYPGGITTGLGGMAPNSRVVFNYAYGAASVGQPIMVQLITSNVNDFYYWEYTFTGSSDTNWHTMIIYFPGSPYQPQFALPPWATAPLPTWSTTTIGGVEVGPANPATAENYDMFFDNFEFD